MGIEVQAPQRRYADEFTASILHVRNAYADDVKALTQPKFGCYDDDEILRDKVKAEAYSAFIQQLDLWLDGMTSPRYEPLAASNNRPET